MFAQKSSNTAVSSSVLNTPLLNDNLHVTTILILSVKVEIYNS